ncbi:IpaD/SipD/SspD family type III secretion system needle tip protein [Plesiomonas shigelloides]|uniref:type III secretion system needle tip protein SctA n=1 Tax=Plesiomonas shigelloides TaxID=703 RepID=UPI0012625E50|nr:type III secretion system needle tip protein SctA [Plesiomonas shigelloides]KAB7715311.1 IpaD/SipD/SspD family type III secretion system needle tip protein [Plesiomonas shigelloides]
MDINNSTTLRPLPLSSSPSSPQETNVEKTVTGSATITNVQTKSADVVILDNALKKSEGLINTLQVATYQNEQKNDRLLAAQQFESSLQGIANSRVTLEPEQKISLQSDVDNALHQALSNQETLFEPTTAQRKTISDKELWEKIAHAIGQIGEEYLEVYENVVGKYTEFYTDFSDILSQMGGWISPGGKDGNQVKLNVKSLLDALNALQTAYTLPKQSAVLFPSQTGGNGITGVSDRKVAEQWAEELGLPKSCVIDSDPPNGKFVVVVDLTPINAMIRDLDALGKPDDLGNVELDNAKFQAWQAGFKAQEENLKNTLQTLTQKYSSANSLYDNLVKVLSSTISSCLETAKSFLQG